MNVPGQRIPSQNGQRYGQLVVTDDPGPGGRREVAARCDCGAMTLARLDNLRRGLTTSCGCHHKAAVTAAHTIDGRKHTLLYARFRGMHSRVRRDPHYIGVEIDPRWSTFEGFRDNPPTTGAPLGPGMVLGRYGDTGPYSPENARWITKSENSREMNENRKRKAAAAAWT